MWEESQSCLNLQIDTGDYLEWGSMNFLLDLLHQQILGNEREKAIVYLSVWFSQGEDSRNCLNIQVTVKYKYP